jgi:hypothetical protein
LVSYDDPIGTSLRNGGKYTAILSLVYRVIEWGANIDRPPPLRHFGFPSISDFSRFEYRQLG